MTTNNIVLKVPPVWSRLRSAGLGFNSLWSRDQPQRGSSRQPDVTWFCCCCSVTKAVSDSATPWTAAHQASLSFIISQGLLKLMTIESVMPSNHLILCRPLLLHLALPLSIFPTRGPHAKGNLLPPLISMTIFNIETEAELFLLCPLPQFPTQSCVHNRLSTG